LFIYKKIELLDQTVKAVRLQPLGLEILGPYLRAKITMHSTIMLHVFRVEATCDKSVILDQRKRDTKNMHCVYESRKNVQGVHAVRE